MRSSITNFAVFLLAACAVFGACQVSKRPRGARPEALSKAAEAAKPARLANGEAQPAIYASAAAPDMRDDAGAPAADVVRLAMAFPTGNRDTSAVLLEKLTPAEVHFGQPFEYDVEVTNLTDHELADVVVVELLPASLRIVRSIPDAEPGPDGATQWRLGALAPHERQIIRVEAIPQAEGDIRSCARVEYEPWICSTVSVVRAALRLERIAPAEVLAGEAIPVEYVVTNTGSATARGIAISEQLPEGLATATGEPIHLVVGSLPAGASERLQVSLRAERTGEFTSIARATAQGDLAVASAPATTAVRRPVLSVETTAPARTFAGRDIRYEIVVRNLGDGAARDARLRNAVPAGAELLEVSEGGEVVDGVILWELGELAPQMSRSIYYTARAMAAAEISSTAQVTAAGAEPATATARTDAVGIPAIMMEVVDVEDPVLVGDKVTYEIRVTNQGSAPGTAVKVLAALEDTMTFVDAGGATAAKHAGGLIQFEPLDALPESAEATWRVTVRAAAPGDVRFKVAMTSQQNVRPIEETEATSFYK